MSRSDRGRIRIGVSGSNPLTLLACFRPTCISGYILVTSAVAFVKSPTRKTDILKKHILNYIYEPVSVCV